MMSLLKRPLRALWVWTYPLRRPLTKRIEDLIARSAPQIPACRVSEETGLLMDLMVRELVRLQKQLDHLQQSVEDLAPLKTGLAVVSDEPESRSYAG
jgi:hypothetical protein